VDGEGGAVGAGVETLAGLPILTQRRIEGFGHGSRGWRLVWIISKCRTNSARMNRAEYDFLFLYYSAFADL
jgi:hypothetical protein